MNKIEIKQSTGVIRRIFAPTQQSQDGAPQVPVTAIQTDDGKRLTRCPLENRSDFAPGDEVIVTQYTFTEGKRISYQIDPKDLGI